MTCNKSVTLLKQELEELKSDLEMEWPNKDTLDLKKRLDAVNRENIADLELAICILESK